MVRVPAGPLALIALVGLAACGRPAGGAATASIVVDTATRHQIITGWEATAQAGHTRDDYPAIRDTLMKMAAHELGITRVRLEVRAGAEHGGGVVPAGVADRCARYVVGNDNDDPFVIDPAGFDFRELDHTIEQVVLPLRREVEARGEKLLVNANYIAFLGQCPADTPYAHEDPEEYAEFVLAVFQHMQERWDFVPDLWEVVLEPENTRGRWDGRRVGNAMVATARRLEAHGFEARFVAPSVTKAGNAPRYFDEMAAVPGALDHLEELSYHRYRGVSASDLDAIALRAREHNLRTAMLEHIGSGHEALHEDLTRVNVSTWQQYTLAYGKDRDDGAQYYLIRSSRSGSPRVELADQARYLRHYFNYVRPGAVRIAATTTSSRLDPVAFINPDGRLVIVLKAATRGTATLAGLPPGRYRVRYTTRTETHVSSPDAIVDGGPVTITMPAAGTLTLTQF